MDHIVNVCGLAWNAWKDVCYCTAWSCSALTEDVGTATTITARTTTQFRPQSLPVADADSKLAAKLKQKMQYKFIYTWRSSTAIGAAGAMSHKIWLGESLCTCTCPWNWSITSWIKKQDTIQESISSPNRHNNRFSYFLHRDTQQAIYIEAIIKDSTTTQLSLLLHYIVKY